MLILQEALFYGLKYCIYSYLFLLGNQLKLFVLGLKNMIPTVKLIGQEKWSSHSKLMELLNTTYIDH